MELPLGNTTTGLDQAIGQGRFAMINMGDNAKITNMFHANGSGRNGPAALWGARILIDPVDG